jgi:hypothetical protein
MKPLIEFILACLLIFVAGCSAIAGIFSAGLWSVIFVAGAVTGLIVMLSVGKNRQ